MRGRGLAPIEAIPPAAAVLDASGAVIAANAGFAKLAGRNAPSLAGSSFFGDLAHRAEDRERGAALLNAPRPFAVDLTAPAFGARQGTFRIRIRSFEDEGARFALVVVDDVSEAERLRAEHANCAEAFEVASHVRHEINNSLMGMFGHLELLLSQPGLPAGVGKRAEILMAEMARIRDQVAELGSVRKI
jgi:PAS domain-containing protein